MHTIHSIKSIKPKGPSNITSNIQRMCNLRLVFSHLACYLHSSNDMEGLRRNAAMFA